MADHDAIPKAKKFFFDQHCFDDGYVEEPEFVEPAPPTFSEAELETARQESYARGKKDGLEEARISREKIVADLIKKISSEFTTLFAAESARNAQYEAESVYLARAAFSRMFPGLNEKHGLQEVERIIIQTLEHLRSLPEIVIEVHQDYVESVQAHIASTTESLSATGICRVAGNESLGKGDCRLVWQDGGGSRSADAIAAQIMQVFEQTLADRAPLRDNGDGSHKDGREKKR
ncbi:MAG TPA: flagellar protein FlbE [Alphaproteobacteria bacterium]